MQYQWVVWMTSFQIFELFKSFVLCSHIFSLMLLLKLQLSLFINQGSRAFVSNFLFQLYRRLCCKGPNPTRPNFSILCIGLEGCGKSSILAVLSGDDLHKIEPTVGKVCQYASWRFRIVFVYDNHQYISVLDLGCILLLLHTYTCAW